MSSLSLIEATNQWLGSRVNCSRGLVSFRRTRVLKSVYSCEYIMVWLAWCNAMMVWQRTKNNHGRRWQCNIPIQNVNLPSQLPIRDYLAKREQQQHQGYSPILICTSHCESTRPRAVFADAKQCVTECNLEYFKFWGKLITDLVVMEINYWE